jgi:LacI family repressor for deo operon, udp, cdd, tsx, nupC, and nupG
MVVLPSIGDPFFTRVMAGIHDAARNSGYSVLIEETQFNTLAADKIGSMLVSKQTDGIILLASMSPFGTDILSADSRRRLPIVIGCESIVPEHANFPSVHIDNVAAASEATSYLIAQGHRRIGMIYGLTTSLLTKDRESGFRAAMSAAGLPIDDGWVVEGQLTIGGAREATRKLIDHPRRPSAIFCANDEMAIGCLHEIKAAGLRIPADMSVVGFDDIRYAEVSDPPLTTISQPAEEIGKRVVHRLLNEIENGAALQERQEIVPHKLVIRQSVGAPRDDRTP